MDIKVKAFPAVYLNAFCTRHGCRVEIQIKETKPFGTNSTTGAQITTVLCKEGGAASNVVDCSDDWELSILANGEIKIGL